MLLTFTNLHRMDARKQHVISPVSSAQIGPFNEHIEEGAFLLPAPFTVTRATAIAAFDSTVPITEHTFIDLEIIASQGLDLRKVWPVRIEGYGYKPPWLPITRHGFEYDVKCMSLHIPSGGPGCILLRITPSHDIPIRWFRLSLMLK